VGNAANGVNYPDPRAKLWVTPPTAIMALASQQGLAHLSNRRRRKAMPRIGEREPSVSFGGRISVESDQLRQQLQSKLGLSVAKLFERSLGALQRELKAMEQPAE
jgi:hypothetical protein